MDARTRHNVVELGQPDGQPLLLSHGFGCDHRMWRNVVPRFTDRYRVVLFDHAGSGDAHPGAYDLERHSTLDGYASDVLDVVHELDLRDVVFVGHSVSSMIGVLAERREPERFAHLVLVGPSPRYVDDGDYVGGFTQQDVEDMLSSLDSNFLGWSAAMAPAIVNRPDAPEYGEELTESFCRTDPEIARRFARVTFLSDNRADLSGVRTPTLVLQCRDDVIAPVAVGEYVARAIPDAELVLLDTSGHCPNLSAPNLTADAIETYLVSREAVPA